MLSRNSCKFERLSVNEGAYFVLAFALRAFLSYAGLGYRLENRIEIITPFNSWKRVKEGIALKNAGISPYEGDSVHCNPILLLFYETLMRLGTVVTQSAFFVADLLAAHLLARAVIEYRSKELEKEKACKSGYAKDVQPLLLEGSDCLRIGRTVLISYLFNPLAVLSSVAMTLTTFSNLIVALALFLSINGSKHLCFVVLAFATVTDVYPIVFIVPTLVSMYKDGLFAVVLSAFTFSCSLLLFVYLSYVVAYDWSFLSNTFGSLFILSDLTPNVGLFWYYFAETFEHYRLFFLCIFHFSFLTYALPISFCLRDDCFTACFFLLFVVSLFKSYPSVCDTAIYSSILPAFSHLFYYARYGFPAACTFIACSVLSCIMWHLWIEQGSANANFFFAVTLAYAVAQILLMTGLFYAYFKRRFHLKNGMKMLIDGEEAIPVLD
uniref:Phosphatidylinositol glycan anchor biosynthesis class U protein n=1 Tax=Trichuris muris TaxID=70415 RepID=A0A5S6QGR8_TRIMR